LIGKQGKKMKILGKLANWVKQSTNNLSKLFSSPVGQTLSGKLEITVVRQLFAVYIDTANWQTGFTGDVFPSKEKGKTDRKRGRIKLQVW
jgi:hypothetical protein